MTAIPKARIAATYDSAAEHFDDPALSFWQYYGERTVERAQLKPGDIVLDVCSGSGASAIPAAHAVAPNGRVIGLDISNNLISLARAKSASLTNIEFRLADFDQAYFRNASFEAVICVFGLFFFPDMRATLQKMWRLLRPGGRLAITTWAEDSFEPLNTVFWNAVRKVRPDLYKGFNHWDALTTPDRVQEIFPEATIEIEDRDHPVRTPDDLWTIVTGSGYRGTIDQMTPAEQAQIESAVRSIQAQAIRTPVLYSTATR
jgi:ubiquinone/menaquinone biosynthesis C-methylase UbiE